MQKINLYKIATIVFTLLITTALQGQTGQLYVLPSDAVSSFINPDNKSNVKVKDWVNEKGGEIISKEWIIEQEVAKYIVFSHKYKYFLFGPYTSEELFNRDYSQIEKILDHPDFIEHKANVGIYKRIFQEGDTVTSKELKVPPLYLGSHKDKQGLLGDITESIREHGLYKDANGEEILNGAEQANLQKQVSEVLDKNGVTLEKGGDGKNGNGLFELLKTDVTFSKWFAVLFDVILTVVEEYFQIPLRENLIRALGIIDKMTNGLVSQLASKLAEIQKDVLGDSDELNEIADVINKVHEAWKMFKSIQEILQKPEMRKVLGMGKGSLSWKDFQEAAPSIAKLAKKAGVKTNLKIGGVDIDLAETIGDFPDAGIKGITREVAKQVFCKKSDDWLKKATKGKDFLEYLDADGACNLIFSKSLKRKDVIDELQKQVTNMSCGELNEHLPNQRVNCSKVIDGFFNKDTKKIKKGIEDIVKNTISEKYDIPIHNINSIVKSLKIGKSEDALKELMDLVGVEVASKNGLDYKNLKKSLKYFKKNNYEAALKSAMKAIQGKDKKWLGKYSHEIKELINNPNQQGMRTVLRRFFDKVTRDEKTLNDIAQGGIDIWEKADKENISFEKAFELVIKERLEEAGIPTDILDGDFKKFIKSQRQEFVKGLGELNIDKDVLDQYINGDLNGEIEKIFPTVN